MNYLENIKDETIERAFPELTQGIITVTYKKMKESYFEHKRLKRRNYHISVDTSLTNVPREIVIGGLSHELAHISLDFKRPWIVHELDIWLYSSFPKYETWDERRTDILVVERGLGQELLSFTRYADKRRERYKKKDGLTAKELRKMLE